LHGSSAGDEAGDAGHRVQLEHDMLPRHAHVEPRSPTANGGFSLMIC